ncbi:hypothetical protein KR093_005733 [Drosophila rubida]|uniref:Uncharacterized protein n=1 Tax=Drosophila rubida TaxID=30044 RepID=A0AAD4PNH3_9MUSC|nr:hypothetical protein KR093_005733 [Drosophila rubida]
MENRSERKQELPCKSMLNLLLPSEFEAESSLNPLASEFVPSYLKNETPKMNANRMKSETTSTTTLGHHEVVGDASYLHAQRQLFELLHQLGNKLMPLKAINVNLTPDGHGVNVQFQGEPGPLAKQILNEPLCQNATVHLEMSERSFMPRRLPNVLAANFMTRMGDVLNDKMAWSDQADDTNSSSTVATTNSINSNATKLENQDKRVKPSTLSPSPAATDIIKSHKLIPSSSGSNMVAKKQLETPPNVAGSVAQTMRAKPSQFSKVSAPRSVGNRLKAVNSKSETRQRPGIVKLDAQHE